MKDMHFSALVLALENSDATNSLKALVFTPRPVGMARLPMIVYLP